jgi:hypothetical protein
MSATKEQMDEFCLNLIRNTESAEVMSWLEDESKPRSLGVLGGTKESIEFIQEVFDAGAVQVFAVEIDDYEDSENTGKICVELPTDPKLRQRVLDWTGEIACEQGFEQQLDVGQQYVFMMLD